MCRGKRQLAKNANANEVLQVLIADLIHAIGILRRRLNYQIATQIYQYHTVFVQMVVVIAILISQELTVNWLHAKRAQRLI
jgi:hypothetical protein